MPLPIDLNDLLDDPEAFVELAALLGILTRDEVEQLVGGPAPEQAEPMQRDFRQSTSR